jgi:hypothetical protein
MRSCAPVLHRVTRYSSPPDDRDVRHDGRRRVAGEETRVRLELAGSPRGPRGPRERTRWTAGDALVARLADRPGAGAPAPASRRPRCSSWSAGTRQTSRAPTPAGSKACTMRNTPGDRRDATRSRRRSPPAPGWCAVVVDVADDLLAIRRSLRRHGDVQLLPRWSASLALERRFRTRVPPAAALLVRPS